jgi:hypothetical protein
MAERKEQVAGPRVSIFLAGVQKCGTTSMFHYLRRHPEILVARKRRYAPASRAMQGLPSSTRMGRRVISATLLKEVHFFDDDRRDWREPEYSALEGRYPLREGLGIDCSPSYILHVDYLRRIHAYNPAARVLLIYRDPVARAHSHWKMRRRLGKEPLDFMAALSAEADRLASLASEDGRGRALAYVSRGRYASQLRAAMGFFPREQLHLIDFQDLVHHHSETLTRVADFLEIRPFRHMGPVVANAGPRSLDGPSAAERGFIWDALSKEMAEFEELSGISTRSWKP